MATLANASKTVAANLRVAMEQRGISAHDLAKRCGVYHTRIYEILRGETDVRVGTLDKVATGLGVPLMSLFFPVQEEIPENVA